MAASMRLRFALQKSAFATSFSRISRSCNHRWAHTLSGRSSITSYTGLRNVRPAAWQTVTARTLSFSPRLLSTDTNAEEENVDEYYSIIKNTERSKGPSDKHEFQAETRKLLDIVAKSLYSEKEVFIRELISNCNDALEKLRYVQMTEGAVQTPDQPLEIHIAVDDAKKTFTIQDTGIGMTKDELIDNLGTIAKSGSGTFLKDLEVDAGESVNKNIIGQFGVGFYSAFMVGEGVEVFTHSAKPGNPAYHWKSKGDGEYEITEAEGVTRGTKVVVHLKGDSYEYAKEETIKEVIKKYSNFVGVPIYLNGKKVNVIQALWTMEQKDITEDMHEEFYRFIANAFDKPRYHLHYKADAPLNIRALFYVPDYKPTVFDMSRETDVAVTLYSRKVMIMAKANHILPRWLRFLRGVVDSEDIPLNLSRELLQDSSLIRKLRWVLTNRLLKFFQERARKDAEKYNSFYEDYGMFFREGIVTTPDQSEREEIAKLLRFESSKMDPGQKMSLEEYAAKMKAGSRNIYFFSAPSRHLAESSPYMEAMMKRDIEVLFCYEPYDELVLMNLGQFDKKTLKSIENEVTEDSKTEETTDAPGDEDMSKEQSEDLIGWIQATLGNRVQKAKITHRLDTHPCIVTVTEMGAARHFLRTALADKSEEERLRILQPTLEMNPKHAIVMKLAQLKNTNPELARLLVEQLYDNAMIAAGLIDDPRSMLNRMNALLTKALENH